jgi:hypothetical protein
MAPLPDVAKGSQGHRQRPSNARIVPAIPLPYIQKRKQQAAAGKKSEEKSSAAQPPTPVSSAPSPTVEKTPSVSNGVTETATIQEEVEKAVDIEGLSNAVANDLTLEEHTVPDVGSKSAVKGEQIMLYCFQIRHAIFIFTPD